MGPECMYPLEITLALVAASGETEGKEKKSQLYKLLGAFVNR